MLLRPILPLNSSPGLPKKTGKLCHEEKEDGMIREKKNK
jgi:hypothetical protein